MRDTSCLELGKFSSLHHKVFILVDAGFSNYLLTVAVSCSDELSYTDYMGTNSQ